MRRRMPKINDNIEQNPAYGFSFFLPSGFEGVLDVVDLLELRTVDDGDDVKPDFLFDTFEFCVSYGSAYEMPLLLSVHKHLRVSERCAFPCFYFYDDEIIVVFRNDVHL